MLKFIKYFFFILILTYIVLNLAGCFTFRLSEKEKSSFFKTAPVKVEYHSYIWDTTHNRRIHYALTHNEAAPNFLVFVHGSPGSGSNFYAFLKDSFLLQHFQMASVDRPGFGYSDFGTAEPSLKEQARSLIHLLNEHRHQSIFMLGHSLGGPVIVQTSLDFPELVKGLFILAGSVAPELEPKEPWRKWLHPAPFRWILPKSFRVSNDEILPLKQQLQEMDTQWHRITSSIYVLQGMKDNLVHPGNARYVQGKVSDRATVITLKDANHFIPFMHPEIVRQHLIYFIESYGKEKKEK